jgi:hypothetical protein
LNPHRHPREGAVTYEVFRIHQQRLTMASRNSPHEHEALPFSAIFHNHHLTVANENAHSLYDLLNISNFGNDGVVSGLANHWRWPFRFDCDFPFSPIRTLSDLPLFYYHNHIVA